MHALYAHHVLPVDHYACYIHVYLAEHSRACVVKMPGVSDEEENETRQNVQV